MSPAGKPLPNRACIECKRKKTRCDKRQPECSLCARVGDSCTYPDRRPTFKSRKLNRPPKRTSSINSIERTSTAADLSFQLWSPSEHEEEALAVPGIVVSDHPCPPTFVSRSESFRRAETERHVGITSFSPTVDYTIDLMTNQDFLDWPEFFPASPLAAGARQDNEESSIETDLSFTLPGRPPGNTDSSREEVQPSNRFRYTLTVPPQVAAELIDLFSPKSNAFCP